MSLTEFFALMKGKAAGGARDKPRRAPSRNEEHALQCRCVRWFRCKYPQYKYMLFAVPNGGKRSTTAAQWLKDEGMTDGVADLILLVPRGGYGALCLETKTTSKSSRLRPSQEAWLAEANAHGNKAVVYRSEEEFEKIVTEYLNN